MILTSDTTLDKINGLVADVVGRGRRVARICVSECGMLELARQWGDRVQMAPAGPVIMTAGGPVVVELRPSLVSAVIVEDSTGEPWISE